MGQHNWKNQKGSVAIIVGVMLIVLLGFVGLALDVGNLFFVKGKMQSAVDAAACAGAYQFTSNSNPPTTLDQSLATQKANNILQQNGFPSVSLTPTFPTDATLNGNSVPAIKLTMTQDIPTYFMTLFGYQTVTRTVSAEAVQVSTTGGPFKYTLFSGDPNYDLTINGGNVVGGSIHSNGQLTLNGNVTVSGDAEGGYKGKYSVTANGQIEVDGNIIGDIASDVKANGLITGKNGAPVSITGGALNNIVMPDYSGLVSGIPGLITYSSSQTFNNTAPSTSIFVNGNVILNGNISNIQGAIVATGNITVNGSVTLSSGNQVCLYSENGNITLNGNTTFSSSADNSIIYAPNGQITFNGSNNDYNGKLIAKRLIVNGAAKFHGDYPFTAIPGANSKHAQLIS